MKLTNAQIYYGAQNLSSAFSTSLYLPAKVNFYIQKNSQTLAALAQEIEENRINIIKHYGVSDNSGNIQVPEDKISEASQEINDLFAIEQDVNILTFSIEAFGDLQLSMEQMNAIMFMIEEA